MQKRFDYAAESKLTAFDAGTKYLFIALLEEDCTTLSVSSHEGRGSTQLDFRNGRAVCGTLPVGSIKNCTFDISVDCKGECYRTSFCSPPLFEPHPIKPGGAIIFYSSPGSLVHHLCCTPGGGAESTQAPTPPPKPATGKYLLEVTCMPKANTVVVPRRLLDSKDKTIFFGRDDLVAPDLTTMEVNTVSGQECLKWLAFKAYCLWDPPEGCTFPVKMYFEYDKFDIRDKKVARPPWHDEAQNRAARH